MSTFLKYPTPSFLIFVFSLIQKVEISKVLFFLFFAAWLVIAALRLSIVAACGLSCPKGMWDLSSPNKDRTHVPCIGRQSLKVTYEELLKLNSEIILKNTLYSIRR